VGRDSAEERSPTEKYSLVVAAVANMARTAVVAAEDPRSCVAVVGWVYTLAAVEEVRNPVVAAEVMSRLVAVEVVNRIVPVKVASISVDVEWVRNPVFLSGPAATAVVDIVLRSSAGPDRRFDHPL
jgi:uncharacterized membrane protein